MTRPSNNGRKCSRTGSPLPPRRRAAWVPGQEVRRERRHWILLYAVGDGLASTAIALLPGRRLANVGRMGRGRSIARFALCPRQSACVLHVGPTIQPPQRQRGKQEADDDHTGPEHAGG